MSESLTKREILRDREVLRRLAKTAPIVRGVHMSVRFTPNTQSFHRIVIFVRRGTGGVARNRIKRIGKEMFRQSKHHLPPLHGDIALLLGGAVQSVPHAQRKAEFVAMVCAIVERVSARGSNNSSNGGSSNNSSSNGARGAREGGGGGG